MNMFGYNSFLNAMLRVCTQFGLNVVVVDESDSTHLFLRGDKLRFTDIGKTAAAREIQSRWWSGFVSARYSKKTKTE